VPKEFHTCGEKGVEEALPDGVLAGFPVVDVKVTLYDGSYHEVDSNENAFKMAAIFAFKDGMRKANPVLLEPIMAVKWKRPRRKWRRHRRPVLAPRRDQGMEDLGAGKVIRAEVPLAEMFQYSTACCARSPRGGRFE